MLYGRFVFFIKIISLYFLNPSTICDGPPPFNKGGKSNYNNSMIFSVIWTVFRGSVPNVPRMSAVR